MTTFSEVEKSDLKKMNWLKWTWRVLLLITLGLFLTLVILVLVNSSSDWTYMTNENTGIKVLSIMMFCFLIATIIFYIPYRKLKKEYKYLKYKYKNNK